MATKKIVISEKHYMTLHTKMVSACRTLERVDGIYDEIDDMYKQLKQLYVNEDKNKNLVDSIREIKVNDVDSDDEKKDESAIREQIENLVKAIIDGDVARSNHIEWEIMQNTVNDKKKIRKCQNADNFKSEIEALEKQIESLSKEKSELETKKAEDLEKQKERLEEEKFEALSIQKIELERKKANELEKQKEELEAKKAEELSAQEIKLKKEKAEELEKQKEELEAKKAEELSAQERKLKTEKANELEKQKEELEAKKAEELSGQEIKLKKEKAEELEKQKEELETKKAEEFSALERKLKTEKAEELEKQKEELEAKKAEELSAQEIKLKKEKAEELEKQKEELEAKKNKEIQEAFKTYKPMLSAMLKCKSMKPLLEEIFTQPVADTDKLMVEDAVQFTNYVGQGDLFAGNIRKQLRDYKENDGWKETLTENELSLINEINVYYRSVDPAFEEKDILDCLEIDKKENVDFKRSYMQTFDGNNDLYEATGIFVPALINSQNSNMPKQKAVIKGN